MEVNPSAFFSLPNCRCGMLPESLLSDALQGAQATEYYTFDLLKIRVPETAFSNALNISRYFNNCSRITEATNKSL